MQLKVDSRTVRGRWFLSALPRITVTEKRITGSNNGTPVWPDWRRFTFDVDPQLVVPQLLSVDIDFKTPLAVVWRIDGHEVTDHSDARIPVDLHGLANIIGAVEIPRVSCLVELLDASSRNVLSSVDVEVETSDPSPPSTVDLAIVGHIFASFYTALHTDLGGLSSRNHYIPTLLMLFDKRDRAAMLLFWLTRYTEIAQARSNFVFADEIDEAGVFLYRLMMRHSDYRMFERTPTDEDEYGARYYAHANIQDENVLARAVDNNASWIRPVEHAMGFRPPYAEFYYRKCWVPKSVHLGEKTPKQWTESLHDTAMIQVDVFQMLRIKPRKPPLPVNTRRPGVLAVAWDDARIHGTVHERFASDIPRPLTVHYRKFVTQTTAFDLLNPWGSPELELLRCMFVCVLRDTGTIDTRILLTEWCQKSDVSFTTMLTQVVFDDPSPEFLDVERYITMTYGSSTTIDALLSTLYAHIQINALVLVASQSLAFVDDALVDFRATPLIYGKQNIAAIDIEWVFVQAGDKCYSVHAPYPDASVFRVMPDGYSSIPLLGMMRTFEINELATSFDINDALFAATGWRMAATRLHLPPIPIFKFHDERTMLPYERIEWTQTEDIDNTHLYSIGALSINAIQTQFASNIPALVTFREDNVSVTCTFVLAFVAEILSDVMMRAYVPQRPFVKHCAPFIQLDWWECDFTSGRLVVNGSIKRLNQNRNRERIAFYVLEMDPTPLVV